MELDLTLIACPRCTGSLSVDLACAACGFHFPASEGIPWLYYSPETAVGEWKVQFLAYLGSLDAEAGRLDRALAQNDLPSSTRKRLAHLQAAKKAHAAEILDFLKRLPGKYRDTATSPASILIEQKLARSQSLVAYYHNAHRDWAWGDAENRATLDALARAVGAAGGSVGLGKLAVLGAGAGRLAYDVHEELHPISTILVDFNPLLLLLATRVLRGEEVPLHEFPLAPVSLDAVAVATKLRAPRPPRPGIGCLLADALRPPFRPGSLGSVLTPWFVDILPEPPSAFLPRINSLLKPGGRWFSLGSLAFELADARRNLSPEEFVEAATQAGFEIEYEARVRVPYMQSPHSAHGRVETLFVFAAKKVRAVEAPPPHAEIPSWCRDIREPVPAEWSRLKAVLDLPLEILESIDGKRSIADLAQKILVKRHHMEKDEAEAALRTFFLARVLDSAR